MAHPEERLHITLMGGFRLVWGTTAVPLDTPSYQSLLAYLVLSPGQTFTRQHLAYTIWPDSTEKQARTNLRKALYVLRRVLPDAPCFLHIDRMSVAWREDAPYALDVAEFETAVAHAQHSTIPRARRRCLEQAVDLYQGDLLPDHFQDWISVRREALRQQFLNCLSHINQLAEEQHDYLAALAYAQRIRREDPLNEAACRSLMRSQAVRGNRTGALQTYRDYDARLQRELGTAPGPASQELYQHLLNVETEAANALPARVPLVAREKSWAFLQKWWTRACYQQPVLVSLEGEAGIGKTRLAEELLDWAAQQGFTALRATCYATSMRMPYTPIHELLRSEALHEPLSTLAGKWQSEIGRVLPELLAERPELTPPGPITEEWQQQHLFAALATAVWSTDQPLMLFIDNLHWCDPDTLAWLAFFLRYDAQARGLLIGAVRSGAISANPALTALYQDLRKDNRIATLQLGRLDKQATADLATHITGKVPDAAQTRQMFAETEGVPLFIVEMVRSESQTTISGKQPLLSSEQFAVRNGVTSEIQLPDKVRSVIEQRLANLSPAARALIELAAAIGRFFTTDLLLAASTESATVLTQALDELWQMQIIRAQGANAYDFSHDNLRKVAYASLPPARRRLLHGRIVTALETLYVNDLDSISGQLAAHCEAAGQIAQAIGYYQRAANVAQSVHAQQATIQYLECAVALFSQEEPDPQQQIQLYERLADALVTAGRGEEAEELLKTAVGNASGTPQHLY